MNRFWKYVVAVSGYVATVVTYEATDDLSGWTGFVLGFAPAAIFVVVIEIYAHFAAKRKSEANE